MKWMLVVLVGGMTPVDTDLVFDRFTDCLGAEEQMQKHTPTLSRLGTDGLRPISSDAATTRRRANFRPNACSAISVRAFLMRAAAPYHQQQRNPTPSQPEALAKHGRPEIFNTDQGSQFTSLEFTDVLLDAKIAISMDGKGAWRDNVFVERLWRTVQYEEVVCCERHCSKYERWRCFIGDEGRPLEVGLQEQASNRHELQGSRAIVVNVDGKRRSKTPQVRFKETNGSKPLMTCRNVSNDVETGTQTSVPRIKIEGSLSTAQSASGMEAA